MKAATFLCIFVLLYLPYLFFSLQSDSSGIRLKKKKDETAKQQWVEGEAVGLLLKKKKKKDKVSLVCNSRADNCFSQTTKHNLLYQTLYRLWDPDVNVAFQWEPHSRSQLTVTSFHRTTCWTALRLFLSLFNTWDCPSGAVMLTITTNPIILQTVNHRERKKKARTSWHQRAVLPFLHQLHLWKMNEGGIIIFLKRVSLSRAPNPAKPFRVWRQKKYKTKSHCQKDQAVWDPSKETPPPPPP